MMRSDYTRALYGTSLNSRIAVAKNRLALLGCWEGPYTGKVLSADSAFAGESPYAVFYILPASASTAGTGRRSRVIFVLRIASDIYTCSDH